MPRLFAVGEIPCVSVHGANRLGGNRCWTCVIFARRRPAPARVNTEHGAWPCREADIEAALYRQNRWNNNRNGEDPVEILTSCDDACRMTLRLPGR
ncbi:hypothetical protein ACNKHX_03605 [Shigella flexneri]